MKRFISPLLAIILLLSAAGCSSGHYVSAQPETVVVARPAQPGPNYVWIDGDYYWRGGRYVQRPGYWVAPRAGRVWHSGGWVNNAHGYYWRRGRW